MHVSVDAPSKRLKPSRCCLLSSLLAVGRLHVQGVLFAGGVVRVGDLALGLAAGLSRSCAAEGLSGEGLDQGGRVASYCAESTAGECEEAGHCCWLWVVQCVVDRLVD